MYILYSLILTIAFVLMSPLFLLRREKYAAGFNQRLGNYPEFKNDDRKVIWLHCVSVGETNAARPLVDEILKSFPDHRLVISSTTKTSQELAQKIFAEKADAVIYFPFDWKFSVRKALAHYKPSLVLLMETEIWPRFIREAKLTGAKAAIVNGRLSARSFGRYSKVRPFIRNVLADVDLALMQAEADAKRIALLGIDQAKVKVTGNLKFDLNIETQENALTKEIETRLAFSKERPLIIAASTHKPEEEWILEAFAEFLAEPSKFRPRLLIAPRHPERFNEVTEIIRSFGTHTYRQFKPFLFVRRSGEEREIDTTADVILLDTIGELRAVYPLAEIVFVGGSLIPHGGQSVLEPAAAGKAIVTGPHTHNFDAVVKEFLANDAIIQLPEVRDEQIVDHLFDAIYDLLDDGERRQRMGNMALKVMIANRGATASTIARLKPLMNPSE